MSWLKKILGNNDASAGEVDPQSPDRDWKLIEKVVSGAFDEQKKARRWGIVFKLLTFAYLFVLLLVFRPGSFAPETASSSESHTALISINGMIADNAEANANAVAGGLRKAFKNENAKAILLGINSPGGSPVQSGYIYDEILRLKKKYPEKKVYAVISDLGASGAYYIAAAADEIYANRSSLVGSIGVTASGFGFVGTLEKLGIERRHYTAGEHKAFLDPFTPEKDSERAFWGSVLEGVHEQFKTAVRNGRGDRLKETPEMYSGLVWSGEQALKLGLIDALGSAGYVARDVIGEEDIRDYTVRPNPLDEFVRKMGVSIGEGVAGYLNTSAHIPELR
ncbi:MAG: S49 family peptidase [Cellvibrionaceae bacterium]